MKNKEEIEDNRIPKQLAKALGIEKEDEDSLIAFKESLFEKTVRENIELKKKVEQIKIEAYWQGYIAKQNEAVEICKQCKCREKARGLETQKQELIEKLEETRNNLKKDGFIGYSDEIQEILEILKGDKQ